MTSTNQLTEKTYWNRVKHFFKNNVWGAPAALSAFVAILSLITAINSASAAKDSAESAKQSIRLQQILEKRALEDQRAKVEFSGGSITYIGLKDDSSMSKKFTYTVELKMRNYGVRPATDMQVALNIGDQNYKTDPRVVPGGLEAQIFIKMELASPVENLTEPATIGAVFYDQYPTLSTQSENTDGYKAVCGPIEIRTISIHKTNSNQTDNTKFLLNAESAFQYNPKIPTQSISNRIPFYLDTILSNSKNNISCTN